MADPIYFVRSGISPVIATWAEIRNRYGSDWSLLHELTTWEFLRGGIMVPADIFRVNINRRLGSIFNRVEVGQATFILDNFNGDYTPETNVNAHPNNSIGIVVFTDNGSWHNLFQGFIDTIAVNVSLESVRQVVLQCSDRGKFMGRTVTQSLHTDIQVGSMAALTFSRAGFASDSYQVGVLADELSFANLDQLGIGEATQRLIDTGANYMYVDGRGIVQMKGRNFDVGFTVTTSLDEYFDYQYSQSDARIINQARITGTPRRAASQVATVAFFVDEDLILNSGDVITLELDYLDPVTDERAVPCASVTPPTVGSSYTLNSEADGTGTDLTSKGVLVFEAFATSCRADITYTGSQEARIAAFSVDGFPLRKDPEITTIVDDEASQRIYDFMAREITNDLVPTIHIAQDYADWLVTIHALPLGGAGFSLKNEFPQQLEIDLTSFVSLVQTHASVASAYMIEAVEHDISFVRGLEHTTIFEGSLAQTKDYLVLDKDPEGKLDADRVLGF